MSFVASRLTKNDKKRRPPLVFFGCHATVHKMQVDTGEMVTRIWKRGTSSVTTGTDKKARTENVTWQLVFLLEGGHLKP